MELVGVRWVFRWSSQLHSRLVTWLVILSYLVMVNWYARRKWRAVVELTVILIERTRQLTRSKNFSNHRRPHHTSFSDGAWVYLSFSALYLGRVMSKSNKLALVRVRKHCQLVKHWKSYHPLPLGVGLGSSLPTSLDRNFKLFKV